MGIKRPDLIRWDVGRTGAFFGFLLLCQTLKVLGKIRVEHFERGLRCGHDVCVDDVVNVGFINSLLPNLLDLMPIVFVAA